ncbi:hypothetical protein FOI42_RS02035 [Escherichia coli]|nr:hypothetical protein [Escherichia coli]MED6699595.1 hypothetical protein [Escherichia coli O157]USL83711.1 structural protein [Escherichia phage A4]HCQ0858900.1 hypothetical protein [Escherichia coli]
MSHHGVYMYPYNQEVSLGNFNMPFNNDKLTIYRGANNNVTFTVHNADGKYTQLKTNEYLTFMIFDARNNTILFDTVLEKILPSWLNDSGQAKPTLGNSKKVYYGCIIPAGIIQDTSPGSKYRWSITKVTMDGSLIEPTQYLYTGLNYEASSELIISDKAAPVFVPSIEVSADQNPSWKSIKSAFREPISDGFKGEFDVMCTSPLRAQMQYGLVDGLSTIAIYCNGFIGRIQLQGCLSNDVPSDSDNYKWFIIKLDGKEYIENGIDENGVPVPLEGIQAFNFKGNYMWLRVVVSIRPISKPIPYDYAAIRKIYNPLLTVPKILIRR